MSQIDRYLDSLFDQLAGTGEHGRRLLLETEDHLRAAASDAAQRGLSPVAAEAEAIKRFGSLEVIAEPARHANSTTARQPLVAACSVALLAAVLACATLGAALLARGVGLAALFLVSPDRRTQCPGGVGPGSRLCAQNVPVMQQSFAYAAVLIAIVIGLFVALRAVNRRAARPVFSRQTVGGLGVLFLGLAVFLYSQPDGQNQTVGVSPHMISSLLAALTAAALLLSCTRRVARLQVQYRRLGCKVR